MASRKEQKEQARAARLQQEQEAAAKRQRTRRLQILGGAVAIVVIVVVVVILATSGGGGGSKGGSSLTSGTNATTQAKAVANELAGIPQSGTTLGKPSAKVTLDYFGDLECPICADFTLGTDGGGLPQFIAKQVKPGNAKITYYAFCTATCNNETVSNPQDLFNKQQVAALAAGKQNKFWNYAELFYHLQGTEDTGYVTDSYLTGLADQIPGLTLSTWKSDRNDKALLAQVSSDNTLAEKYGIDATPSLVVEGPKGIQVVGSGDLSYSVLAKAVKAVS